MGGGGQGRRGTEGRGGGAGAADVVVALVPAVVADPPPRGRATSGGARVTARLVAVRDGSEQGATVGAGHWRAMGGGGRTIDGGAKAAKGASSAWARSARTANGGCHLSGRSKSGTWQATPHSSAKRLGRSACWQRQRRGGRRRPRRIISPRETARGAARGAARWRRATTGAAGRRRSATRCARWPTRAPHQTLCRSAAALTAQRTARGVSGG